MGLPGLSEPLEPLIGLPSLAPALALHLEVVLTILGHSQQEPRLEPATLANDHPLWLLNAPALLPDLADT